MIQDSMLPMQGVRVRSLVEEPRSHKTSGVAKKKNFFNGVRNSMSSIFEKLYLYYIIIEQEAGTQKEYLLSKTFHSLSLISHLSSLKNANL